MPIFYNQKQIKDLYYNNKKIVACYYDGKLRYTNTPTRTFYPSDNLQTYVIPRYAQKLYIECVGSQGMTAFNQFFRSDGGKGGKVTTIMNVKGLKTLYVMVGKQPILNVWADCATATYNASDIRTNNRGVLDEESLKSRIIVAGGGGNSGFNAGWDLHGGAGGGLTGGTGASTFGSSSRFGNGGNGGTQTEGGAGGTHWGHKGWASNGANGRPFGDKEQHPKGIGGNGVVDRVSSGAGGAGYCGGGGGGLGSGKKSNWSSGGGGGSSYTNSAYCYNVEHKQGFQNGSGYVKITPYFD